MPTVSEKNRHKLTKEAVSTMQKNEAKSMKADGLKKKRTVKKK